MQTELGLITAPGVQSISQPLGTEPQLSPLKPTGGAPVVSQCWMTVEGAGQMCEPR